MYRLPNEIYEYSIRYMAHLAPLEREEAILV